MPFQKTGKVMIKKIK